LFGELNEKQAEYTDDILSSGRLFCPSSMRSSIFSKVELGGWSWSEYV